ncbi:hypothetical protein SynWH8103_01812 [Synechococcus sp. WH 8103]|nr:hypothetical protein SynWH8103_01812 [Synechococcus sp. WH 8103]
MGEKRSDGRYDRYAHYLEGFGFQGELAITQPLQPDDVYQLGSGYDVEAG